MDRLEEIRTADINLAASIMTATNRRPASIIAGHDLVEFAFPADDTTRDVTLKYAAGTLTQEVRRFASNRSWLYRQAREASKAEGGVRR